MVAFFVYEIKIMADTERRRFKRMQAKFLATFKAFDAAEEFILFYNKEIYAVMFNLSEGGMAFTTSYDIPIATRLLMRFTLINRRTFSDSDKFRVLDNIEGKVCSNTLLDKNEHRIGIQFNNISKRDKLAIANFVKDMNL